MLCFVYRRSANQYAKVGVKNGGLYERLVKSTYCPSIFSTYWKTEWELTWPPDGWGVEVCSDTGEFRRFIDYEGKETEMTLVIETILPKRTKSKDNQYKFEVDDSEKIDLDRIAEEQWANGIGASIIRCARNQGIVLCHVEWLRKFSVGDERMVAGRCLSNTDWGSSCFKLSHYVSLPIITFGRQNYLLKSRFMEFDWNKISEIKQLIKAAHAYQRKITVTVIGIGEKE